MSNTKIKLRDGMNFMPSLISLVFLTACSPYSKKEAPPASSKIDTAAIDKKPTPVSYTVEIQSMKFEPEEINIHSGDTITWVNHDMVAHNVTEELSKTWSSSVLKPNTCWQMVATKSADYYCNIHTGMKGKIIVQ